jgi:hypothetical protein
MPRPKSQPEPQPPPPDARREPPAGVVYNWKLLSEFLGVRVESAEELEELLAAAGQRLQAAQP